MNHRLWAKLVALAHICFVMAVGFGGFALLLNRRWAYLHLPLVVWAALVNLCNWTCPLTPLEKRLLMAAGEAPYGGGFAQHYLSRLLRTPFSERSLVRFLGVLALVWNGLVYALVLIWL